MAPYPLNCCARSPSTFLPLISAKYLVPKPLPSPPLRTHIPHEPPPPRSSSISTSPPPQLPAHSANNGRDSRASTCLLACFVVNVDSGLRSTLPTDVVLPSNPLAPMPTTNRCRDLTPGAGKLRGRSRRREVVAGADGHADEVRYRCDGAIYKIRHGLWARRWRSRPQHQR